MSTYTPTQVQEALLQLGTGWSFVDEALIQKTFQFNNFVEALAFVNKVGAIAEEEQHHPDIHIHYNKVIVELSTHDVDGLTQKDFDVANNIDAII